MCDMHDSSTRWYLWLQNYLFSLSQFLFTTSLSLDQKLPIMPHQKHPAKKGHGHKHHQDKDNSDEDSTKEEEERDEVPESVLKIILMCF